MTEQKSPTTHDQAAQAVTDAAALVTRWTEQHTRAVADLEDLRAVDMGPLVIDAPDEARRHSAAVTAAQVAKDQAEAAVAEAKRRHAKAVRALARVEASAAEAVARETADALAKFDARTAELRDALTAHTRMHWTGGPLALPGESQDRLNDALREHEPCSFQGRARAGLEDAHEKAARRRDALQAVADGQDPAQVVPDLAMERAAAAGTPMWIYVRAGLTADDLTGCLLPGGPAALPGFSE